MNNKYAFHCRTCGFTFMSDNKEEVKAVRNSHKRRLVVGNDGAPKVIPKCVFIKTEYGTRARPDIAGLLNKRWKERVKQAGY